VLVVTDTPKRDSSKQMRGACVSVGSTVSTSTEGYTFSEMAISAVPEFIMCNIVDPY